VAHNQDRGLTLDGLHLLKSCENEDGSFSQTGLGLADDIVTENGLRNALLLDWISQLCQNRSCQVVMCSRESSKRPSISCPGFASRLAANKKKNQLMRPKSTCLKTEVQNKAGRRRVRIANQEFNWRQAHKTHSDQRSDCMTRLLSHCSCVHGMASPSESGSCQTRAESAPQSKCSAERTGDAGCVQVAGKCKETLTASSCFLPDGASLGDGRTIGAMETRAR
jgi:hypothetical protein